MIPKKIHYCWFGKKPLPHKAKVCIESWKKHFPDYEIIQWNEDNFNVNIIPYTTEAYSAKKYAFVSDYARFFILYNEGGIYFDTDVEVIRPMDDIIEKGAFLGYEESPSFYTKGQINPGLGFGCEKNNIIIGKMLEFYNQLHFKNEVAYLFNNNICTYTTEMFYQHGLKRKKGIQYNNSFTIYPPEYFSPIHFITKKLKITKETRTIHRYMASWTNTKRNNFKKTFKQYVPDLLLIIINRIKRFNEWDL